MGVELFTDCHGIRFGEIYQWLPNARKDWPRIRPVKVTDQLDDFRMVHRYDDECWLCGRTEFQPLGQDKFTSLQTHHVHGGSHKSNEWTNFVLACPECHSEVQSQRDQYARVWLAKWVYDPGHVDWVRLTLLMDRFPDFDISTLYNATTFG